ncbi:MAG: hypothetical protein HC828_11565, partial [Blastochloris sp.]|nr:hypothetical protein [Blastochloris sp.]
EVKNRFGGSIRTEHIDTAEGTFIVDGPAMIWESPGGQTFWDNEGLGDLVKPTGSGNFTFSAGAQTLIDALAARLKTGTIMRRMAVSSVGALEGGRFGVCLENGLLLETRGIIVAVPPCYAAHMLYSLNAEASLLLDTCPTEAAFWMVLGYRLNAFLTDAWVEAARPYFKAGFSSIREECRAAVF